MNIKTVIAMAALIAFGMTGCRTTATGKNNPQNAPVAGSNAGSGGVGYQGMQNNASGGSTGGTGEINGVPGGGTYQSTTTLKGE